MSFAVRPQGKLVAWSWSALKLFESCPKKYWHLRIRKDVREKETEIMQWGKEVHKALEQRVGHGKPLPKHMAHLEKWAEKVEAIPGKTFTEHQMAVDNDLNPVTYFAKNVRCRAVADVLKVKGGRAVLVDWKTGKIRDDEIPQLELQAVMALAHFDQIEQVDAIFIYTKEDDWKRVTLTRDDMLPLWASFQPRIRELDGAVESGLFEARTSGLCRYCPVTACPHHPG